MEILRTIWIALTTENEFLTKIITAPTIFIEAYLLFMFIASILKLDFTKKEKYFYIISLSISSLITELFVPTPYNVILNYLIMFILNKKCFKLKMIKLILSIIISNGIFALISIISLKPILIISKMNPETIASIPLYKFLYQNLVYLMAFLVLKFINNSNIKFIFNDNFTIKNKVIILINLAFGLFTLCVQLIINSAYTNILPSTIIFLSFISLLGYFILSFYSLTRVTKLQVVTQNLESAENYNQTLTYLYDNVKAFQHDFNNMIFIIDGYIESDDIEGLKLYHKSLIKDCEKVNNTALLNPKLINNSGIYNLLIAKYKKASENNVEIHLEYFFDLEKLKMQIYEFSRILGILLDNAIESAKETEERKVNILFRDSQMNNTQIITIENSFNNTSIDTKKIFEKGFSEKENHAGVGLWEVNQILKRISNANLITSINENYFKQSLEIYY